MLLYAQGNPTRLKQECKWKLLFFQGTFDMTVDVSMEPEGAVDFQLVQSKFMKSFTGRWRITNVPEVEQGEQCLVKYVLEVQPALSPPPAFASYTAKIFVQQARAVMEDLQAEVWRRSQAELILGDHVDDWL